MFFSFGTSPNYTTVAESEYHDEDLKVDGTVQSSPWPRHKARSVRWWVLTLGLCTLLGAGEIAVLVQQNKAIKACSSQVRTACLRPPIRREWRTLPLADRHEYIAAVQCLGTKPSKAYLNGSLYDDFPRVHQATSSNAHKAAPFLPWHRYFLHTYETALKQECGYSGIMPYWDWSQDWKDMPNSPVWDAEHGFGGDGVLDGSVTVGDGRCIRDGPFVDLEAHYFADEAFPHCLSRGFASGTDLDRIAAPVSPEALESLRHESIFFEDFAPELEIRAHTFMRDGVRGDFRAYTGPYDPVFFLHHANIDRLWAQWQSATPGGLNSYGGPKYDAFDAPTVTLGDSLEVEGLLPNIEVASVMDTTDGIFCYQY